ncbi:hypothetical protein, partial [Oleiphilus sp. HI0128]
MSTHPFLKLLLSILALSLVACGSGSKLSDDTYDGLVTIEGQVSVKPDTNVDLDVEQTCSTLSEQNNSLFSAQLVSNPITIGGYINGKSQDLGFCYQFEEDLDDYYRVSLVEGQTVSLSVFPANEEEFNINALVELRAVDQSGVVVAELSISEPGAKSLVVPLTNEYYVRVATTQGHDALL